MWISCEVVAVPSCAVGKATVTMARKRKKEEWTKGMATAPQFCEVGMVFSFHKWRDSVSEGEDGDAKIKAVSDEDEDLNQ